jgi:hypothetical protein
MLPNQSKLDSLFICNFMIHRLLMWSIHLQLHDHTGALMYDGSSEVIVIPRKFHHGAFAPVRSFLHRHCS